MPRGQKTCPSCNSLTGPRTKICSCGHKFHFKPAIFKTPRGKSIDWTTLEKGDIIKCINGHGPYYLSKDNPGEKIGFNYKGKYKVRGTTEKGIEAFPYQNKRETGGYCFIYMGEPEYCEDMSIHREPHKIVLLQKDADDDRS